MNDRELVAALTEVMDQLPVALTRSSGVWQIRATASGGLVDSDPELEELLVRALGRAADASRGERA